MNQEENIISYVRVRPVQDTEKILENVDEKSVIISRTSEKFSFEKVFDESQSTQDIFEEIGVANIDLCFEGKNVCFFAYGQTSSGKTYTMKGTKEHPGIIPQSLNYIFKRMESQQAQVQVKVSFLEIYNETIIDLLNPKEANIEIREHYSKGIYIQNLSEKVVSTREEAEQLYSIGESNRKFAETSQNTQSSRSHVIFRLNFELRDSKNPTKTLSAVLNLIDLAGSENIGRSKIEKDSKTKAEGVNINKSLLALSNVINRLSQNMSQYINYRDSKLTRLLQPCLGGNSRTVVICAVNPSVINYQETRDTLNFGKNAGAIKNVISVNEKAGMEKSSLIKESYDLFSKENSDLKAQVEKYDEIVKEKETTIQSLQEQNEELTNLKTKHVEKIIVQNEELNELRTELFSLRQKKEDLTQNNLQLSQLVQTLRSKEQTKQKQESDAQYEVQSLQSKIALLEENINRMSSTYQLMQEEGLRLTNQNQVFQKTLEKMNGENQVLQQSNKQLGAQILDLQKKLQQSSQTKNQTITSDQPIIIPCNGYLKPRAFFDGEKENLKNGNTQDIGIASKRLDDEILCETFKPTLKDELLENLQKESFSLTKHVAQNQELEELHVRLAQLENQIVCANYKINELQQEILFLQSESSESKLNSNFYQRKSFFSDCDSSAGETMHKRIKKDEYSYIKKKIDTETDGLVLKREVRNLNKRIKNLESLSESQRHKLTEKIEQLKWVNIIRLKLENRMLENGLTTDNLLP